MPLNLNKYINKKKNPLFIRLLRIYLKTLKQIFKKTIPFLCFAIKVLFWLVLFGLILIFTNYSEKEIPFYVVFCAFVFILLNFYNMKDSYKSWQNSDGEFYRRFCKSWHPSIINYLFVFAFGIVCFDTFQFILFMFLTYCVELWDRRFITSDIKQDLILEKLGKH